MDNSDVRSYNVGTSDYSKHTIQPWSLWINWHMNPFDADILKRLLRHKMTDSRKLDYEKIIHICKERIRQLNDQDPFKDIYKAYKHIIIDPNDVINEYGLKDYDLTIWKALTNIVLYDKKKKKRLIDYNAIILACTNAIMSEDSNGESYTK